ncbi:MAG: T9SS type A sorting domain-containing protein, partial [Bacteroidetes bacterium]|nr:T9SS type A sorting domain-containing protein [Bacteroidota bacterium]
SMIVHDLVKHNYFTCQKTVNNIRNLLTRNQLFGSFVKLTYKGETMKRNLSAVRFIVCVGLMFSSNISFAQITYSYGTYTGDGNATQDITWVGFKPDVLLVKADNAGAGYNAWVALSSMPAGYAKDLTSTGVLVTGRISSLTAVSNGFRVGNNAQANNNTTRYYFIAFKAGVDCKVGVQNTQSDWGTQATTGFGFQPEMVWLFNDGTLASNANAIGLRNMIANNKEVNWYNGNYQNGNHISTYDLDGFTSGTWANGNDGTLNYYAAFNFSSATTAVNGTYVGNSADDTDINCGTTAAPDFVIILNDANAGQVPFRTSSMATNKAFYPVTTALTAGIIKSTTAGNFRLGTAVPSNNTGSNYYYAALAAGNTLPVELLSFTAKKENDKIVIRWSTASEINNDFFSLERSVDGDKWEIIKEIKGAGNSSSLIEYSETDENPHDGISYYRLKQTDYDGQFKYSQTASVGKIDGNLNITAFPNPVNNYMFVEFETKINSNIDASLYDQNGARVKEVLKNHYDKGAYKVLVYTDDLPAGLYYIRLNTNVEGVATKVSIIH